MEYIFFTDISSISLTRVEAEDGTTAQKIAEERKGEENAHHWWPVVDIEEENPIRLLTAGSPKDRDIMSHWRQWKRYHKNEVRYSDKQIEAIQGCFLNLIDEMKNEGHPEIWAGAITYILGCRLSDSDMQIEGFLNAINQL